MLHSLSTGLFPRDEVSRRTYPPGRQPIFGELQRRIKSSLQSWHAAMEWSSLKTSFRCVAWCRRGCSQCTTIQVLSLVYTVIYMELAELYSVHMCDLYARKITLHHTINNVPNSIDASLTEQGAEALDVGPNL